jgi:hypothetical protein
MCERCGVNNAICKVLSIIVFLTTEGKVGIHFEPNFVENLDKLEAANYHPVDMVMTLFALEKTIARLAEDLVGDSERLAIVRQSLEAFQDNDDLVNLN